MVRQTCRRSKPFKTDPHPYRMALGNRKQQRARDAKLSSGSAERRAPYNRHLGTEAMETSRSKDGAGTQRLRVSSESGSSGLSADTDFHGRHDSLSG